MSRLIGKLVKVAVLAMATGIVVMLVGMRTKCEPILCAVRKVNRAFWNPRAMKTAGTLGAYASVIRHVGRTSGQAYETPIGAEPTDDGFVIAIPYGAGADWVKNVLAAGAATIVDEGVVHEVDRPEVVPINLVESWFPAKDQRAHRLFGVDECLRVHRVASAG